MLSILALILLATSFVYVNTILEFTRGLLRIPSGTNKRQYSVTVLVPVRNEEANIEACIDSLLRQDYPQEHYRIVVIDDQSTDRTADIVHAIARRFQGRVSLIPVQERTSGVSPKINAFRYGIRASSGEILFTTDGDCVVSPQWISSSMKLFDENVGVVTGVTLFRNNEDTSRALFGVQFLDFLSHTACAAGAIGNGKVNNCNGSNMAFRRSAYEEVGGYDSLEHLNSGDDSLLAQKIAGTGKWKVRFNLDCNSAVTTAPVATWRAFLQQRMRWAAQTGSYRTDTLVFLVSSFIYYTALVIALLRTPFEPVCLLLFLLAYVPKLLIDFHILKKFTVLTRTEYLLRFYAKAALIHIPVVLLAVLGGYFGRFDWKGRATTRSTPS